MVGYSRGGLDTLLNHWQSANMSTLTDTPFEVALHEGVGATPVDGRLLGEIFSALLDRGYSVSRSFEVDHLRSLARGKRLLVLGAFSGEEITSGKRLSDTDGGRHSSERIEFHDISGRDAMAVVSLVEEIPAEASVNSPGTQGAWKPWFPVIDYDRCTNCLQCLTFCLFDVYSVDEDRQIKVQNNSNCKTNCPACSRVCPEVAIMFPKYQGGPINGDEVSEADLGREKMKVDISSLLGGDIYASLRNRSEQAKSRFSAERDSDKALAERKRCLKKLRSEGMIPAEVLAEIDLASLPSPEEIKARSEAV